MKWDPKVRAALLKEAQAIPLPDGARDEAVALLWKSVKKYGPKGRGEIDTPYGKAKWIQKGRGGKKTGLVLGLHGGGVGAGHGSEAAGNWGVPKHLGMYPTGIRLIHDTWNSVHGERFLLTLIEIAKAQYGIDPDRVYSMGFSMGGTGSWFMAGRHPDLLAGAIPAHGVLICEGNTVKIRNPEDVPPLAPGFLPNARNLAVYFYTGWEDENCEPGTFLKGWEVIQELKKNDPGGYELIRFKCIEGLAHSFPPGEPGKGIKWITQQRRNAFPEKLVWEHFAPTWPPEDAQDKVDRYVKRWFYWLHCERPVDGMNIVATHTRTDEGSVFDLSVTIAFPEDCTVYLNDRMIDVDKDVILKVDGKEVWRGRPEPDLATLLESLDARLDRTMVFDRKIKVPEED